MRVVEVVRVDPYLSKNNKAKVLCKYVDSGEVNVGLCVDSNVRVGELWYESSITDFGWSSLMFPVNEKETPKKNTDCFSSVIFTYKYTAKYEEVIKKTNLIIEFFDRPGEYYAVPFKTVCFSLNPLSEKDRINISPKAMVNVYVLDTQQ